jgi:hypothetical protein
MRGSLCNRKAGYFMESIATRTVPPYDLGMDINGLSKGLVGFCVVERWPPHCGNRNTVA